MDPYTGEIRLFAGAYAPAGWHYCDGSLQSINTYQVLYSLLGTTYGGDGISTFGLPDLRGRLAVHAGQGPGFSNYVRGQMTGQENITLLLANLPAHTHTLNAAATPVDTPTPAGSVLADTTSVSLKSYDTPGDTPAPTRQTLNAGAVLAVGNSLPHDNQMPCLGLSYIICLNGIYPTPT